MHLSPSSPFGHATVSFYQYSLTACAHSCTQQITLSCDRFGGVICISSSVMEEASMRMTAAVAGADDARRWGHLRGAPLLVTHGRNDKRLSLATAQRLFDTFRTFLTHAPPPPPSPSSSSSTPGSSTSTSTWPESDIIFKVYDKGHEMIRSADEAKGLYSDWLVSRERCESRGRYWLK